MGKKVLIKKRKGAWSVKAKGAGIGASLSDLNVLNEAGTVYAATEAKSAQAGSKITLSKSQKKLFDSLPSSIDVGTVTVFLSHNKIDSDYLEILKQLSKEKAETLSKWLNISQDVYKQHKTSGKQIENMPLRESTITLVSLYKHGAEVFDSLEIFNEWLHNKNHSFFGDKPIDYISTITGRQFIDDRLTAIEYGDNV